jgi:vancomycin resistance protein VanW
VRVFTLQRRVAWVTSTSTHLEGEIRADRPPARSYRVEERDDRFEQVDGMWWRSNEIWRVELGPPPRQELIRRNRARTMYVPE